MDGLTYFFKTGRNLELFAFFSLSVNSLLYQQRFLVSLMFFFGSRLEFDAKILTLKKKLTHMTVQADFLRKERLPDFLVPGDSFLTFVPIAHLSRYSLKIIHKKMVLELG